MQLQVITYYGDEEEKKLTDVTRLFLCCVTVCCVQLQVITYYGDEENLLHVFSNNGIGNNAFYGLTLELIYPQLGGAGAHGFSNMATFGSVSEFNEQSEDWPQYIERLEHYFIANDIDDEGKKRSILLSVVGSKTYKLIKNLLSPVNPSAKTFK